MAYKLNSSGYYVGSDGKKYDAASGWSVSKDGKTLTNTYTGNTVSDVGSSGSTTSKTSNALTSTGANASTPKTVASTSKSSSKTSPRTVTYTSGNSGSAQNSSSTISQANQALNNVASNSGMTWTIQDKPTSSASAAPQMNNSLAGITDQASALAAMMGNSQAWNGASTANQNALADLNSQIASQWFPGATRVNGEWYYNGSPLYNQSFTGASQAAPNTPSSSAAWAVSADGKTYQIDSDKAWDFVNNKAAGSTMIGGDNSVWKKNADGSVTITKNGQEYTYRGNQGAVQPIIPQEIPEIPMYNDWTPMANISIPQAAYALDGSQYGVDSDFGNRFLHTAQPGETMIGSDGSKWTKNEDGSVTILKNGKTYTYGAGMQTGIYADDFQYTPFDQTETGQSMLKAVQDLYDKAQNADPFSYDPNSDPLYMQYADSYTRSGKRAMTDVLGQLAARTGGMASSYAGYMAQQPYDNYMADLANKVPELQQLAYSMWVDDRNRDAENFNRAYTQYADAYNRYGQDTNFRYGMYQDDISNRWKNLLNTQDMYQRGIDNYNSAQNYALQKAATERANMLEDERIQREIAETEYQHQQDALNRQDKLAQAAADRAADAKAQIIDMVQHGYVPGPQDAELYGLSQEELYYLQKWAAELNRQESGRYYISPGYY